MKSNHYPYWAEVSGVFERWFHKHGGQPMPHDEALPLLGNPSDVKELSDDGYHYERQRADDEATTKCVYTFKDASFMDQLNKDVCVNNFQSYDDFRAYVNADDKRLQIETAVAQLKRQSPKLSWAIGFVATLDEYNDTGLNELTPYMEAAFEDALATLREHANNSSEARKFLEIGEDLKDYVAPIITNAI